jgi:hypothetical protein
MTARVLAIIALLCIAAFALTYSFQMDDLRDRTRVQQDRITELEIRLTDLECRHVRFEDGATIHADAERVAECVYTAPIYARYGD